MCHCVSHPVGWAGRTESETFRNREACRSRTTNRDWALWARSVVTIVQTSARSLKLFTVSKQALTLAIWGCPAHTGPRIWADRSNARGTVLVGFGPRRGI